MIGFDLEKEKSEIEDHGPANPANPANPDPLISRISTISNGARLKTRIIAMAKRWGYSADELENALSLAKQDPAVWLKLVEHDEASH